MFIRQQWRQFGRIQHWSLRMANNNLKKKIKKNKNIKKYTNVMKMYYSRDSCETDELWKSAVTEEVRRCLHDAGSSFIPERAHPGTTLKRYIRLHDSSKNLISERLIPERVHPGSCTGSKFSFWIEI